MSGRDWYAQSNSPLLTSSWLVLWLVACAGNTTEVGAIFDASQYSGVLVSVYWVGAKLPSMNWRVPTGCVWVKVAGLGIVDQMCWGTIGVCAIVAANGTSGALKVNVT